MVYEIKEKKLLEKFGVNRDKCNILFYVDDYILSNASDYPRDTSLYLIRNLQKDSYFNVSVSSTPNVSLAENANIVVPRFDPPLKDEFISELKKYDDGTRLFLNPIESQKYFSDKSYLMDIARKHSEILPRTIVSSDPKKIGNFMYNLKEKGCSKAVYKPTIGFCGKGIEKIDLQGKDLEKLIEMSSDLFAPENGWVIQEFIEGIEKYGSKKIHIIDGEPVGALLRFPEDDSFICDGDGKKTSITDSDIIIIEKIMPFLEKTKTFWAGVDIIGPYLGEINAVSSGGVYPLDEVYGNIDSDGGVASAIINKLKKSCQDKFRIF
jgi:glutathione synthase